MQDNSKLKMISIFCIFVVVFIGVCYFTMDRKKSTQIPEQKLKAYSQHYGYLLWEDIKKFPIAFSLEDVIIGMKANEEGKKLSEEESDADFLKTLIRVRRESLEKQAAKNLKIAEDFLEKIAKKTNILTIEEGMLYCEITAHGTGGWCVEPASISYFHYTITTIDGKKIVDTQIENIPQQVNLTTAFPCFTKGVIGMKKGEKRTLYAHPDLAYGRLRQIVPPDSLVVIEVESLGEHVEK